MTNKLIIAAAGSGKTTLLIKSALKITNEKVIITTFTEANEEEIKKKFYEINGCIPSNIVIQTWFSFLIQHGVKPYQSVMFDDDIKGLLLVNQKSGYKYTNKFGKPVYYGEDECLKHYLSSSNFIYSDKLSKFVVKSDEKTNGLVIKRISKIYQHIFIDEVQDMAGYDLEIIKLLLKSNSNLIMVGDPRQVTYHTHDETKYKKYSNGKICDFITNECKNSDIEIDTTTLNKTYRNNKEICAFANSIYPDMCPCSFLNEERTNHDGVFFIKPEDVEKYLDVYNPMQLRDKVSVTTNKHYEAMNFGDAKGLTFERVLIYPTKPMLDWIINHDNELKFKSRSRLYVVVTRARSSVAIIFNKMDKYKVEGIKNFNFE